jgi:MFS family permease
MIFLRIISFFAGSFVLFGSPFLLLSEREQSGPGATVLLAVVTVLLFATGYFFFALLGHRTGRSPQLKALGAGLVLFQVLAGAWLLAASHNTPALVAVAPLLCFTVFLFMAFVWPGDSARSHRPMRRRERIDELQHY